MSDISVIMSYNYINDCLKAGVAYRREFYTDRDVEPTNTLMFTISIVPFADINSPSFTFLFEKKLFSTVFFYFKVSYLMPNSKWFKEIFKL